MLNNLKRVVSNTIIYSIGNLSTKLIGIVLIPIYTSKLTTSDYGMLGILEITSEFLVAVFGLSLYQAFLRLYWDDEYKKLQKEMFFTVLISITLVSLLMFFGLYPLLSKLSLILLTSNKYSNLVRLMITATVLKIICKIPSTLMRAEEKPLLYTVTNIVKLLVILVSTIYLILCKHHNIDSIFEAQIMGHIAYLIMIFPFILKNISLRFEITVLKEMLRYSLPLVLSSLSGILLNFGDRYCLRFLSEFSSLGIYNLGFKFANTLKVFFVSSIQLALPPIVYKMINKPNNLRFYSKIMTYIAYLLMFVIIAFSVFSKEMIKLLVKNTDYYGASTIIPVISFSILFLMLMYIANNGLIIQKKTGILATIVFSMSILNVILNIGFIPIFGIIGAALATLISRIIHFALVYRHAQKVFFIPYELTKIAKIVIVGLTIFGVSRFIQGSNIYINIVLKILILFTFPIILYFWKFYEPIELERIKQYSKIFINPRKWNKNRR